MLHYCTDICMVTGNLLRRIPKSGKTKSLSFLLLVFLRIVNPMSSTK